MGPLIGTNSVSMMAFMGKQDWQLVPLKMRSTRGSYHQVRRVWYVKGVELQVGFMPPRTSLPVSLWVRQIENERDQIWPCSNRTSTKFFCMICFCVIPSPKMPSDFLVCLHKQESYFTTCPKSTLTFSVCIPLTKSSPKYPIIPSTSNLVPFLTQDDDLALSKVAWRIQALSFWHYFEDRKKSGSMVSIVMKNYWPGVPTEKLVMSQKLSCRVRGSQGWAEERKRLWVGRRRFKGRVQMHRDRVESSRYIFGGVIIILQYQEIFALDLNNLAQNKVPILLPNDAYLNIDLLSLIFISKFPQFPAIFQTNIFPSQPISQSHLHPLCTPLSPQLLSLINITYKIHSHLNMSHDKKPIVDKRSKVQSYIDMSQVVVIDNGTDTIKIGMSGVDYPHIIIDTVAGLVELNAQSDVVPTRNIFFGEPLKQVLQDKKEYKIKLSQPIENAIIDDKHLEEMSELWKYALTELLGLELANTNVLLIDSCSNKKDYKAKLAEVMFEKLKINSLLMMNSSALSLFSTGATTGFVAELGHGLSTVIPVFEGFVLPHALQQSDVSGQKITKLLEQELQNEKITISASNPLRYNEIIRQLKQKMCQVAYDYNHQLSTSDQRQQQHKSYELPDGKVIQLSKQTVYKPCQIIFNPKLINSDSFSLPDMMKDSLSRCDPELASEMRKNIVVCGGTSIARGIQQRLEKEFEGEDERYEFVLDWQRRYSAWIGGSMLGSLSTFQSLAIQLKEYSQNSENKSAVIYKKTF